VSKGVEEVGTWGNLNSYEVHSEVIPIRTSATERVTDLTVKLKRCVPGTKFVLPACWDAGIFSKRLTLSKVNNEVVLHQQDQAADAGTEQPILYLTEMPEVH
jgi:hypothetical protein